MEIQFTLKNTSGADLFARFAAAIKEEGIGYDEAFSSAFAVLSEDGRTWTTSMSDFTYWIMNPESSRPATVVYNGAWRGFLAQNLIPDELRGETIFAAVVEGSALTRHGVENFVLPDAHLLARTYGLMQHTVPDRGGRKVFEACIRAIEGADEVNRFIKSLEVEGDGTYAYASNNQSASAPSRIEEGDPVIRVACAVAGRQVFVDFDVDARPPEAYVRPEEHSLTEAADKAKAWLEQLQPVLQIRRAA